ncbi:hypothetical protein Cni_G02885 [Canna indica]|uniref:RING-type domain-containing protein n=1 Tax=Canna indica TaxID=4628 RepID=A0AAQ3JRK2_9LILI|nr:hypothetical protein Cni_G02885 [Canna indica]
MRRLLDTVPNGTTPGPESQVEGGGSDDSYFNSGLLVILAALLFTLVCVLGLNSIVGCVMRCRRRRFASGTPGPGVAAAATGLKKQALRQIPIVVYGPEITNTTIDDCAICLSEFTKGDTIRMLPECHHGFHVRCIDAWLALQPSCPICRHSVVLDKGESSEVGDTCSQPDDNDIALRTNE